MQAELIESPVTAITTAPKFVVGSGFLNRHIKSLISVVSRNPIVPILENILFHVSEAGLLTLTASDLQSTIICTLPVERLASSVSGLYAFAVNARRMYKLLNSLPDQPITIRFNNANQVSVLTESGARYNLYAENAGDFPKIKAPEQPTVYTMPGTELAEIFLRCLSSVSNDDLRPAQTGIYIDGRFAVATDGHRLVRLESKTIYTDGKFIIPQKTASIFLKTYGKSTSGITVAYSVVQRDPMGKIATHPGIQFSFDNYVLIGRLIDERFPDYQNVIPTTHQHEVTVNRQALIRLLGRVGEFADRVTHQVRLSLNSKTMLWTAEDSINNEDCVESIAATITDSDPIEIGFNAVILTKALKSMPGTHVQFRMSAPHRAAVIHPSDGEADTKFTMLVMPVMLAQYSKY